MFAGLNLRLSVASVPPVVDEIESDLGLSSAGGRPADEPARPLLRRARDGGAGPHAPARRGADAARGTRPRHLRRGAARGPSVAALFAGTIVAGAGIAVANVVVPAVVKARFEAWTGVLMGVYVAALGAGAALAAGLTAPLARELDGQWNVALAVWAVPAAFAVGAPRPGGRPGRHDVRRRGRIDVDARSRPDRVARDALLRPAVARSSMQASPGSRRSCATRATPRSPPGTALALYALLGIPPSLVVPVLAARMRDQRPLVAVAVAFEVAAIVGLLLAPGVAFLWVACFAIGQGAAFSLALTSWCCASPDAERAASLSALAQSVGYTIAAAGPFLLGALHDATDGWRAPLAAMLACTAALLAAGLGAGRPALVGGR